MRSHSSTLFLCALLVALTLPGCAPRQQGASPRSFYASGLANFSISVSPPLTLVAEGRRGVPVPADEMTGPRATFNYALFADVEGREREGVNGEIRRQVHTVFSELPRHAWRWEKETWALPSAVFYSTLERGGKFWTVQILPVASERDWFSALWRENGREVPDVWLAKRWSSTPEEEMRVLAEYREPAPACMRQRLRDSAAATGDTASLLSGKTLAARCAEEIDAFSIRADQAVRLERMLAAPEQSPASVRLQQRPAAAPDMAKLVGRAQKASNDSSYETP